MRMVALPVFHGFKRVKLGKEEPPGSSRNRPAIGFPKARLCHGMGHELFMAFDVSVQEFRAWTKAAFGNVQGRGECFRHGALPFSA